MCVNVSVHNIVETAVGWCVIRSWGLTCLWTFHWSDMMYMNQSKSSVLCISWSSWPSAIPILWRSRRVAKEAVSNTPAGSILKALDCNPSLVSLSLDLHCLSGWCGGKLKVWSVHTLYRPRLNLFQWVVDGSSVLTLYPLYISQHSLKCHLWFYSRLQVGRRDSGCLQCFGLHLI